ncbi:M64 family metallopeptidase [Streptomyces sp. PsTaAH-124]|uniref:M64 family metallopeptidase n=1 Tax=Streptomyces sp. PsTaAH-124 TaxID=1157638 RepID=UPI000687491F|nr:M64 family metallopeptidase [Streptomyces sp. PsTaAH-124]
MPHRRKPYPRWTAAVVAALVSAAALVVGVDPPPAGAATGSAGHRQNVEYFPDPWSAPRQVTVTTDTAGTTAPHARTASPAAGAAPTVRALQQTGPVSGRLDLVVLGDGYTAAQKDDFTADAEDKLDQIFRIEPYRSYRGLFNIWLVDTPSPESGVSGDPTADVRRTTALGSFFFCDGLERLLCIDPDSVTRYAAAAPAADIVFVIANSAKYGGAGYSAVDLPPGTPFHGVATMSSDNDRSYLIGAHELGHSIGHLADEYQYAGYGPYPSADEPDAANLTLRRDPAAAKWHRWLGAQDPTGSAVGTYEGGGYYETGVYRPTETSLMRDLSSTDFNVVGREAMIAGFYADADALTSPLDTARPIASARDITVRLAPLTGLARLRLDWYVDGKRIPWAAGRMTVTPRELAGRRSAHRVTAVVSDRTGAVRDPAVRQAASNSLTWTVR